MRRFFMLSTFICVGLLACNDLNGPVDEETNDGQLKLLVDAEVFQSKGVSDEGLTMGSCMGIYVAEVEKETYNGQSYVNVAYTKTENGWETQSPVMLSSVEAELMAYWPYDSKVSSIYSIPVVSESQTDYLYATPVRGLTKYNSVASVRMCHALASLKVVLVKGSYAGGGNVSSISLSSPSLPTSACLDASSGELSGFGGFGHEVSSDVDLMLSFTPKSSDLILIPAGESLSLSVSVMIDGVERSVDVSGVSLLQGCLTQLTLIVNDSEIVVSGVSVEDWDLNDGVYDVHISGSTDGVAFSHNVCSDGSVVITAVPINPGYAVDQVSVVGECSLEQSVDSSTGIRTVILSDLSEDVSVCFNGAWQTMFRQLFYIDSESVGKEIILFPDDTMEQMEGVVDVMTVDGVEMQLSQYYIFDSSGKFWVDVNIPPDAVVNVMGGSQRHLIKAEIPIASKELGSSAFSNCSLLESVSIPGSVEIIGSYAFYAGSKLTSVSFAPGLKKIDYSAFKNCCSLKQLCLPVTLKTINTYAFYNCCSLESLEIDACLDYVGKYVFGYCSMLKEVDFKCESGDVTFVGPVFDSCHSLETITLPANISRECAICEDCPRLSTVVSRGLICPIKLYASDYSFSGMPSTGVLRVPEGAQRYEVWLEELGDGWRLEYF